MWQLWLQLISHCNAGMCLNISFRHPSGEAINGGIGHFWFLGPQEYYSQDNVVKIHIPVQFVLCLLMAAASQLSWKRNTGLQGLAGNPEKCLTTKGNCHHAIEKLLNATFASSEQRVWQEAILTLFYTTGTWNPDLDQHEILQNTPARAGSSTHVPKAVPQHL